MKKGAAKSLVIRNEQLALELLRVRSRYAKLKRDYGALKALLLVSKVSASTQTSARDMRDASYDSVLISSSGGKRRDLKQTYQSPLSSQFDRHKREDRTVTPAPHSTPTRTRIQQSTPRKPTRTRSARKSTESTLSRDDVEHTPVRPSSRTKYRSFSGEDKTGVEVLRGSQVNSTEEAVPSAAAVVEGEKLSFEFDDALEWMSEVQKNRKEEQAYTRTPPSSATKKAMRRADRFITEEKQLFSRPGRRVRTPVSYREPSLITKVRKGHRFFEFE